MSDQKPAFVKIVGLVVSVLSGLIIFSNGMGALTFFLLVGGDDNGVSVGKNWPIVFISSHYILLSATLVALGSLYLVGALNVRKYKLWANKLVSMISVLLIVIIWLIAIALAMEGYNGIGAFIFVAVFTAAFWTIPIILLIRFLNKPEIRKHFS